MCANVKTDKKPLISWREAASDNDAAYLFMFTELLSSEYKQYIKAWKKAEITIKVVEQLAKQLNIASVIELRYAGRRFIDILSSCIIDDNANETEIRGILFEATQNCIRARNDAIDVFITFVVDYIIVTEDRYSVETLRQFFPEYRTMRTVLFEAEDITATSRGNALNERQKLYDKLECEYIPQIQKLYRDMILSEDLIEKSVQQALDKEKDEDEKRQREAEKRQRREYIAWGIAIVGIVIGAVATIVAGFMSSGAVGNG